VSTTKAIRTTNTDASCDVCGRTLLRGERAEFYLNDGTRQSVCDLCTMRALEEGWVREGTLAAFDSRDARTDRRRSFLGRLRRRREGRAAAESVVPDAGQLPVDPVGERPRSKRLRPSRERPGERRNVHAIPSSDAQKVAAAVEAFNGSEYPRTVAGVARSLGLPVVSALPSDAYPGVVNVVVSWELCWYRYEVDLADEVPAVRAAAQGYELEELTPPERKPNIECDEYGSLSAIA
jgi:hypothetical protein